MTVIDETIHQWRVPHSKSIRLKDYDPGWAGDQDLPKTDRKQFAESVLLQNVTAMAESQKQPCAANRWSILMILQVFDAAGTRSKV